MTTPANIFRIRIAGGTWWGPDAGSWPGILNITPVIYALPTSKSGLGSPKGAFGKPTALLELQVMNITEFGQVTALYAGVPTGQEYQDIEFEAQDDRANPPAYETWTGKAAFPTKPTDATTKPGSILYSGVTIKIENLVAT